MNLTGEIEKLLSADPSFRERRGKDAGIVSLLIQEYPQLKELSKETIRAICNDYASLDRIWRQELQKNPAWRGEDYKPDKDILEHEKMRELGYFKNELENQPGLPKLL